MFIIFLLWYINWIGLFILIAEDADIDIILYLYFMIVLLRYGKGNTFVINMMNWKPFILFKSLINWFLMVVLVLFNCIRGSFLLTIAISYDFTEPLKALFSKAIGFTIVPFFSSLSFLLCYVLWFYWFSLKSNCMCSRLHILEYWSYQLTNVAYQPFSALLIGLSW